MTDDTAALFASSADFFTPGRPVVAARAPGRLDVMGGIADYSGSLVLEWPLACATWVAVQPADDGRLVVKTNTQASSAVESEVTLDLRALFPNATDVDYAHARALLTADSRKSWAAYVAGALVVLAAEKQSLPRTGMKVLVRSDVPIGSGVSSSAALEVAALEAMAVVAGIHFEDAELALAAQKLENLVVGAPCGVMDQMAAACGRTGHFLDLLCQPADLIGHVPLPASLELFGIDSGVVHAVSGAPYRAVRTAAFMGYRIVAALAGLQARPAGPGKVVVDDDRFGGYLANVGLAAWQSTFREGVPTALEGRPFLDAYEGITDATTDVEPTRVYAVRACTEHPIAEHERVTRFRTLLAEASESDSDAASNKNLHDHLFADLGALMYESHASYSACGLGTPATDRIVELVRSAGPAAGLFGAKITGGGSGGTVAVLARRGARRAVEQIAARYAAESGVGGAVLSGSSAGAREHGTRTFTPSSLSLPIERH